MTQRLIDAALAAADLFRDGDTPDQDEIRELVRAADDYARPRTEPDDHEDTCLMCAVRALTEGDPAVTWNPIVEGQTISGVVLRMGELAEVFGRIPYVDLWLGGTGRIRIKAYSSTLRHAIEGVAPQIGDRLSVWFDGERTITRPGRPMDGKPYKTYSANVQRGH